MTLTNLRLVNGLCVAMVGVVGVCLSVMEVEISALDPSLYLLGVAAGALIYISACLLEPAFVRRLHRRSGRPEKLPFELVLLQYQFGIELKEVLYFENAVPRPGFSSGNPVSSRRVYLHKGIEEKLNPQQLQGLFAVRLADLALERDVKLWASGGAVFLLLFSIVFVAMRMLPGGTVSFQTLLAAVPILFALLDLLFQYISKRFAFLSDRYAARILVYPDCLLSYLEALAGLESDDEEGGFYLQKGRSGLMQLFSSSSPYPSALERLNKLGALYPGAEQLYHNLKRKIEEKESGKIRASRRKKRHKLFQTIGKGQ